MAACSNARNGRLFRTAWRSFASSLLTLVGLILAVAGKDPVMAFTAVSCLARAGLAFLYILTQVIEQREPRPKPAMPTA